MEIDVASVSTGNDDRDAHLKSDDFFDLEHYPTITFASTGVTPLRDNTWEVAGDLTVHGTTKPVTLQVDFDGGGASPMGDERIGFSAATEVNREDFGLTWNVRPGDRRHRRRQVVAHRTGGAGHRDQQGRGRLNAAMACQERSRTRRLT